MSNIKIAKAPTKKIARRCALALNEAFCSNGFVNQGKYIIDTEGRIAFHNKFRAFIIEKPEGVMEKILEYSIIENSNGN